MKQPPMSLTERLELAAQACRAAGLLSCEETCREAAKALPSSDALTIANTTIANLHEEIRKLRLAVPAARLTTNSKDTNMLPLVERLTAYVEAFAANDEGLTLTPDLWNNLRRDIAEAVKSLPSANELTDEMVLAGIAYYEAHRHGRSHRRLVRGIYEAMISRSDRGGNDG